MEFDLSRDSAHIAQAWNEIIFDRENNNFSTFNLCGPKGCGKTKAALELARSNAKVFYVSFLNLPYEKAVESFVRTYIPEKPNIKSISDAVDAFMKKHFNKHILIIFENESGKVMLECEDCFYNYINKKRTLVLCFIGDEDISFVENAVSMGYRSIAEFIKEFPNYNKYDAIRLHALTGGMMGVAKELDQNTSYEDNLQKLLEPDSAFSTYLPTLFNKCFRTPESYYPILKSIADGHHRLSEIAKDISFPNNKCLKYLEALIKNGFVVSAKNEHNTQSTYHLKNTYYIAWCKYIYGQTMLQVSAKDSLVQFVKDSIDEYLTIPDFRKACLRFMENANKRYNNEYRFSEFTKIRKAIPIKLRDGKTIVIDYCIDTNEISYNLIFPHSLEMRYGRREVEEIYRALERIDRRYYAHTVIFSFNRFSDWCTHKAAHNDWFHIVSAERLKY